MVDLAAAESNSNNKTTKSPKKLKFSPKFDDSPAKKSAKKKKFQQQDGGDSNKDSPSKKIKFDAGKKKEGKSEENKENKKEKKSVQINEEVMIKEIPKEKKKKKLKLELKMKKKMTKVKDDLEKKGKGKVKKDPKSKVVMLNKSETRDKQKKVKEIRKKFKQEDVFDIGVKAKKVWEEVRREDCPEDKKERLINELHGLVQGNIKKIIFAHDTVRVVECLMALGSNEVRDKLFNEMKGDIIEMTKSKYAHFFVQKMLRYGTKEQKQIIFKEMEGQMAKLMKNKTAGFVVETIYNEFASGPQRNCMLQEFLDQEFLHFKDPEMRTVPDILQKYPKRAPEIVKELQKNVEVLIRKGCYNHSLVHTIIYNFMLVADAKQKAEVIDQLKDALIHMVHSREGAYTALHCIWFGNAKDRKTIIKSFKTFMLKTAQEEYGHMVLLGIFDSVDDTKIVGKAVIGELMEDIDTLFSNKYGVRVLKYLFGRRDPTYFNRDHVAILEKGDGNEHSKKDADTRHKELVAVAAPPVIKHILEHAPGNLYEAATTITLTCILNNCVPCPDLEQAFQRLATLVTKPFAKGDSAPNLVENTASNMMFKKLIFKDADRQKNGEATFTASLLPLMSEDCVEAWLACNRGCLLILAIINLQIEEVTTAVKSKLKPYKKLIAKLDSPSGKILQEKLQSL
eukprot:TRINITY_DN1550_c0_g1_i10.p1 TRINITY_DN1550_c0_g1~~TRINITY_DN1550_c0_g1_i10.p1  ORF type:complete len:679 (-),score=235.53 TRINITY_DN1550_c0_g1_i10:362-2398(-)